MTKLIASAVGVLFALLFVFSSYYTVGQGERAVILHYGAVAGLSAPGLHFKIPFVTSVEDVSIQPQTYTYGSHDDPFQTYSRDQQPAHMRLSVTFRITDPESLYSNYTDIERMVSRIVTPRVQEQVKNVFGQFDAVDAIQKRAKLNKEVTDAIRAAVKGPLVIESVQIENIAFSDKYEKAVEDRMEAQVREQQAEAERQQRITRANAGAYEVTAAADAQAHAIQVKGNAEAAAIKARGDALRDNPNLIALTTAEKWNGILPETMLPNSGVPMLNLPK
jgi:regulator of protease activity HflC (stomatin/prohibitin superfamily)